MQRQEASRSFGLTRYGDETHLPSQFIGSFSTHLTNNGVLFFVLQVANGDKVALHQRDVAAVLAGDDGGLAVQRHLVVVLHRRVLLVGDLQGALGDVVDLVREGGREGGGAR